ncbi:MAG TPA: VWA domain-containing protein [Terriglobales bacterium]|nr:VWA domain-containing protein [Terriglobales bacterium]
MRRTALALALWLLGFGAAAVAQQQAALEVLKAYSGTTEKAPFVLRSQVAEVAVQLAVTDRSGKPVMGLAPDDLQVLDNGIPAAVTELRREDELPLRVALVIDWSDSLQKDLGFERKVALDFLRTVLRPDVDQAMVVGFRYRVEVTQPLTGDTRSLEAGLRPVAGVSLSSVYDALIAATDGLRNADPYLPQRRAIVLLSDGEDNVSTHGLLDAIKAAQRANVTIYTIAPRRRQARSVGDHVLMELAMVTGGRAFFISRSTEQPAFETIRRDLRTGYALYFKPGPGDGDHLRSLAITAKDRNLQVWARHSYYASRE